MPKRHTRPLPRVWLMTDERMGDGLIPAIRRLPKGSGVVFRHYSLPPSERRALFDRVKRQARARRLVVLLGGSANDARRHRADGHHRRSARGDSGIHSAGVHGAKERILAERLGADLIFVSPVFPTRSHPGATVLGRVRFGMLVRDAAVPVIALGGMTRQRARSLKVFGIYGWAAISSLSD
jgi:thiamine-phosphate pyrophosphorylase